AVDRRGVGSTARRGRDAVHRRQAAKQEAELQPHAAGDRQAEERAEEDRRLELVLAELLLAAAYARFVDGGGELLMAEDGAEEQAQIEARRLAAEREESAHPEVDDEVSPQRDPGVPRGRRRVVEVEAGL